MSESVSTSIETTNPPAVVNPNSRWEKFVSKWKITNTTKLFFGKYQSRAVITGINGLCFLVNNDELKSLSDYNEKAFYFNTRDTQDYYRKYRGSTLNGGFGGMQDYARQDSYQGIIDADPAYLFKLWTVLEQPSTKENIKTRFDCNFFSMKSGKKATLTLYGKTDDALYNFLNSNSWIGLDKVTKVQIPVNDQHVEIMAAGKELVKWGIGAYYKYKVFTRDGMYSIDTRAQLFLQLKSLPSDMCYMPYGLEARLGYTGECYLHNSYFYINDLDMLTFMKMIAPTFISKIMEQVKIE
jgi:hypothetical protein